MHIETNNAKTLGMWDKGSTDLGKLLGDFSLISTQGHRCGSDLQKKKMSAW